MPRVLILALTVVLALVLSACGDADAVVGDQTDQTDQTDQAPGAAAGTCAEGTDDCIDTPQLTDDEPVEIDETGVQQFAADAQYYLGRDESELPETIRVSRRGDEDFMLTQDYVIGRMTAELDDLDGDGDGTYMVTAITVELPDGPETFALEG